MSLDFGDISNNSKNVCFQIPNLKGALDPFKLPDLNFKFPKLGLPDFSKLNFGLGDLKVTIPEFKLPEINFSGLNFGGFDNFLDKLKNIKVPTTICITVGGGFGIESIFSQLADAINSLVPKVPSISLGIPEGTFALFPQILINPQFPFNLSLEQAFNMVKDNCLQSLLNFLRNLDPFERLKKLLELAADLCSRMLFGQLKSVIEEIQNAQMELLMDALNFITDPIAKMMKLLDMATDAVNSGAFELLDNIGKLLGSTQFESILDFIDRLDPSVAIAAIMAQIRNLVQLKNFGPINQLITILQVLKAKLKGITDLGLAALEAPELSLDALQDAINKLLDADDLFGIQKLLSDFERGKRDLVNSLKKLNPSEFLSQMLPILNDALKSLQFGLFNTLIKDLADKLCVSGESA